MRLLTTDIYEGAYFLSRGMKLEKLWINNRQTKKSVIFEFAGQDAQILRSDYVKGIAQVNVTQLKQALTEIKDRMFALLRNTELSARSMTVKQELADPHGRLKSAATGGKDCMFSLLRQNELSARSNNREAEAGGPAGKASCKASRGKDRMFNLMRSQEGEREYESKQPCFQI